MKSLIALALTLIAFTARAENSRTGKIIDLELSPVGLIVDKTVSIPEEYTVGVHLNDDTLILVNAQKYSSAITDRSDTQDVLNFGVYVQHFATNSFYGKAGINMGRVEYSEWDYNSSTRRYIIGKETRFDLRIGNQWTWGGFILGVDWFGYEPLIVKTVDRDDGNAGSFPTRILQFTQLHLGYSF